MVEFIKLRQGYLTVHEYSLKFTKLSKYVPPSVSNPRYETSQFVMEVSNYLKEYYRSFLLHDNMMISHLTVHAKHVEEARDRRK